MDHDVIIVGGGPSGLSTALHLQRIAPELAPRILILEKARYPRLKLCAGGLVPDAELILQRLGLDAGEVPHVDVKDLHFDFEGRGLEIRIPKRHALRVIRRDEFDAWLASKVRGRGIEILEGVTVRNIIPRDHQVIVETDQGLFNAQVVVGADGSNGITRRCICPGAPVYTARVLEVITPAQPPSNMTMKIRDADSVPTVSDLPLSLHSLAIAPSVGDAPLGEGRWRRAYFDFFPVPHNIAGYVWDFPTQMKGEPMRCWGIYDTNILANEKRPHLRDPLAQEMYRLGYDLKNYEIKGYPIRWFSPENPMSVPRVLLVGDAAGVDPLFGEGISIALGYGAVAARALRDAFQLEDFSFRSYRRRILFSPLGQTLLARWLSAYIVYSIKWKWFQILVWRIMKPMARLAAWLFVLNWGRRIR